MPTSGRAGPRILSSGLRGRLRRAHPRSVGRPVVGLGAAGSGPDWRSIRDVLSVARFASALVSKHQSPLVNACVGSALLQAPSFSYGVVDEGSVPKDRAIVASSAWLVKPHHACMSRCILQPGRHFEPGPRRCSNRAAATGRVFRAVP